MSESAGKTTAHVDEASARLPNGGRLYVIAAVLSSPAEQAEVLSALLPLQIAGAPLHYRDEQPERRIEIAKAIAHVPLVGAILVTTNTTDAAQERARARLLFELLPQLEHRENVHHVVMESRAGGDRHDRRTRDRLRRSRRISALRVDHKPKAEPLLWPADFVASSYVAAHHRSDHEPWTIISTAHAIEITVVDP